MLLARPIHRVFSPKIWVIKKDSTFYGMHVPKYNDDKITETWLLAFNKKNEAHRFSERLYNSYRKRREWPTRFIEDSLYDWNNYDLDYENIDEEETSEQVEEPNPLRLVSVNYMKLLRLAALEVFFDMPDCS